jgi:pimeloyl-ACP methyl ester carboxylesterase
MNLDHIEGPTARFGYRRLGPEAGVPLVLCMRFRGTLDHWDPAFLDVLARERNIIIFDNAGIGLSSGSVPSTISEMARDALEFIDALGLTEIDLLGWSMGGFVALAMTLARPGLVRRLIVAGSNPGGVPGARPSPDKVWEIAPKPVNDDEDFLYLFFPETPSARAAGIASLRRLDAPLAESGATISADGWGRQMQAITTWASGEDNAWDRLGELTMPVLVANGAHDVMTDAYNTYAMATRLPNATAVLYSDAGHGFLFQHPERFGRQILDFLNQSPTTPERP